MNRENEGREIVVKLKLMRGMDPPEYATDGSAAVDLRGEWAKYKQDVAAFKSQRSRCVDDYFAEACVKTLIRAKGLSVFANDASFAIPAGAMPYDIGKGTREMLEKANRYYGKLVKSYNLEVEYGAMMGLASAGKAKREGKSPDEVVDEAEQVPQDAPGSLTPGSDSGSIIDKDHQSHSGGGWTWD